MKMKMPSGSAAPDFTYNTPWQETKSLYDSLKKRNVVIYLIRYMGCPLCQMKIAELRKEWYKVQESNLQGIVIIQSSPETVRAVFKKDDFPFTIACDPDGKIFDLYGVTESGIFGYIAPVVLIRAFIAAIKGFKHGKKEGREMQLPAVFLVDRNKIIKYSYYGTNISDMPSVEQMLSHA